MIIEVIPEGLKGHFAHRELENILDGLTHEQACSQAIDENRSSWETLYHMVYWQDCFVEVIRGHDVDMAEAVKEHWPSPDRMMEEEWSELVERFKEGLVVVLGLLSHVDLSSPLKTLKGAPTLKAFISLAQHNSYHIGQIVVLRRAQGSWS
jgi:uncharacterized damage-inducible protein DinB